jgi:hypothetical protein
VQDPTVTTDPSLLESRLFWQGADALICSMRGPIIIVRGGTKHSMPWDGRISGPLFYAVGDAWKADSR